MKGEIVSVQKECKLKINIYFFLAMFFIGFSLFLYKVLLTRFFSVILSFNLVFVVISFVVLGSGIGGIWVFKQINRNIKARNLLKKFTIWIPLSILLTMAMMYYMPFISFYTIYGFIGAIPFVFGGIVISSIFSENPERSHSLYFMNLAGSALGSLAVIQLMNRFGFMYSVFVVCIILFLASVLICFWNKDTKQLLLSAFFMLILLMLLIHGNAVQGIERNFKSYYSSPNTVISHLKGTDEIPIGIAFSKWDAVSRIDVIETLNENEKIIITDGGESAPITEFNGDIKSVQHLKESANYIPFVFGKNDKTLVIGSGGGKDVLLALLGGSKEIHGVEKNLSTIEAVNHFKDFSGDIYNWEGVEVHIQDGRSFVENSSDKYDNIYFSMLMANAVENTMYSLSQSYIYTYEAFDRYLKHLNKNGKLSFTMDGSMDLIKMVNTGIKVLLDKGIPQDKITDYFVIINGGDIKDKGKEKDHISMPVVIFKNEPFTTDEINIIKETANYQKKDMIHYPGKEHFLYRQLKDKELSYDEMLDQLTFNAAPITDNSPFFYNNYKFFPVEIQYTFLGIVSIWMILKRKYINMEEYKKSISYFMGLGLAYMMVEIPIIQQMVLYFENSSIALSIILCSILISCGVGSKLYGNKFIKGLTDHSSTYLLAVSLCIIVVQLNMNKIMVITSHFHFAGKIAIGLLNIFPIGLLMGISFATGIGKLKDISDNKDIIPLMWGVNGIFTVLGSVLAIMLSMKFGFDFTVYMGALLYLLLYIFNPLAKCIVNG